MSAMSLNQNMIYVRNYVRNTTHIAIVHIKSIKSYKVDVAFPLLPMLSCLASINACALKSLFILAYSLMSCSMGTGMKNQKLCR